MTAEMMQYNFELKINTLDILDKQFTSTDIAILLNKAQDIIVNDRYSSAVVSPRHFEMDEKTRVELGKLITNSNITSFSTGTARIQENSVFANLPSDYLYSLNEQCVVSYTNCNDDTVTSVARVLPVTHDQYLMSINDPFGKPYEKLVWRMDYSGNTGPTKKHELIYGQDNTITSYQLRYLRRPVAIDIINGVDCELHPELHEEIVDMAVQMAQIIKGQTKQKQTQ